MSGLKSDNNLVPSSNYIGNGTVEQSPKNSLKLLANKVLAKKRGGANCGTETGTAEQELKAITPTYNLRNLEGFIEAYNERAAIYENEANYPREESERLAYRDTALEYIEQNHPELILEIKSQINQPTIH